MRKLIISIILALLTISSFQTVLAQTTNYRYTGQELDPSSGLYYYGQRYYQPEVGRFTQPDPVLKNLNDPQALNEYGYVQNNPVKYVDPEGESIEDLQKYIERTGDTLSNLFSESQLLVSQQNN